MPLFMMMTLVSLLLPVVIGCSERTLERTPAAETQPPETSGAPATPAAALPLLNQAQTVGTTFYGGAELPAEETAERALLESAVARGVTGFTYYVDWAELEPTEGDYSLDEFTATLDGLQALGVQPFVNITVVDIDDYNLPDPYTDDAGGLADGVTLADPALIARFGALLDRVVPLVAERGGFLLGVGNEVDGRFEDVAPDQLPAYIAFVEAARDRIHAIEPRLAVGVTVTANAFRRQTATFQLLRDVTDVVPFNYAPIQPDFFVVSKEDIVADFEATLRAFGEGPIVIQELTCPSARSMGASEAWQAVCFEELFGVIAARPEVRFASVFTFQDFDDATCAAVVAALMGDELDDLPPDLAQRLGDYFCELGVIRADGTAKPAWEAVLQAAGGR